MTTQTKDPRRRQASRRVPRLRAGLSLIAGLLFLASGAFASGFSIYEQGAKASGLAGAFVALADDASANWYNPANLVWIEEGSQLQFGANLITAGGDTELTVQDPNFGVINPTTFEPEGSIETPISLYYTNKVNSNIAWGVGVTTPFGLVTDWDVRPITFSAAKSELATFVVNPNVAFRLTERWSVAVGADWMFADVSEFSREVPVPPVFTGGVPVVGFSNLSGDGDELSWNIATSYRGNNSTFALTYRDGFDLELDGKIDFSNFGPVAPLFPSSPGVASFSLPAQAVIAYGWNATPNITVEVDVAWAEWSSFDRIDVDLEQNTPFSQDFEIVENWDDTNSYRIGVNWTTSSTTQWRFGAVVDESPVPEEYLRPSIPDADRTGLSIGYGYKGSSWTVDLYYMPLWFDDIEAVPGAPESEGVIAGEYDTFVQLAGASFGYRF